MKIINNIDIFLKYRHKILYHHNCQFFFKQFRQNKFIKSNIEIDQTQEQRIAIRKRYYKEK